MTHKRDIILSKASYQVKLLSIGHVCILRVTLVLYFLALPVTLGSAFALVCFYEALALAANNPMQRVPDI